uniref:BTB domain-containing protein n=1 Tax=viral metagenome TaxID=1070528 RepID=A0A6C0C5P7_9ZZZZ
MKRKNLITNQDNIKRIKVYDSKNEWLKILECYDTLAKFVNNDPIICFDPKPEFDTKRYFTNVCSKILHLLKFTSDKIVIDSVAQTFANDVPRLIENITKELQSMLDIFPDDFLKKGETDRIDISFYIRNCLENCNSKFLCMTSHDPKLVTISKTRNYESQILTMIENGCSTNHIRLLKLMIEKGAKTNVTSLLRMFFLSLVRYTIEISCIFIDILQSLHYTTTFPDIIKNDKLRQPYKLLNIDDDNILDFALSCVVLDTKREHQNFIDPHHIIKFIKHRRLSIVKSSLTILLNIILYDAKDNTELVNKLLYLMLDDNSAIANLTFSCFTYFVFCNFRNSKKKYFDQIYAFVTNNIRMLNNIAIVEKLFILLKILFCCCSKKIFNKESYSSQAVIDSITNAFNTKKNTLQLLDVTVTILSKDLAVNYGDDFYAKIIDLMTNDDQSVYVIAIECFCRLCQIGDQFVCNHKGLMIDTIINFLTFETLKCRSQCSNNVTQKITNFPILTHVIPNQLDGEICPLKNVAITNMWISLGALISRVKTTKLYISYIIDSGVQKRVFDLFNISAIKHCANKHASFIIESLLLLGFDDCAKNDNVKILIEKMMTIACAKDISAEKKGHAFDNLVHLNHFLNNLRYCFKIVDMSILLDSKNPVEVSFSLECFRQLYEKMNEQGPWDDPNQLTERAINKCTELVFRGNKFINSSIGSLLRSFLTIGSEEQILKNVEFLVSLDITKIFIKLGRNDQEGTIRCICESAVILSNYSFALRALAPIHKMMTNYLEHHDDNISENAIKFLHADINRDNSIKTLPHIISSIFLGQQPRKLVLLCQYIDTALQFQNYRVLILGDENLMNEMIKLLVHKDETVVRLCCNCLRLTINYDECYKVFYNDENLSHLAEGLRKHPSMIAQLVTRLSRKTRLVLIIFSHTDFVRVLFNLRTTDIDCERLWDIAVDNDKLISELKRVVYTEMDISEWEVYAMLCAKGASLEKRAVTKLAQMDNVDQEDFNIFLKIISLGYCNDPSSKMTLPATFVGHDIKNCHEAIYIERGYCDVTFNVDDVAIKCHRCILAAKSEYFDALFSNSMAEKETRNITITEASAQLFQKIIQYIYVQTMNIESVEELIEVFYLADRFDLPELVETCAHAFISILSAENIELIDEFAERNEIMEIKYGIYRWLVLKYATLPQNLMSFVDKYWPDIMNFLILSFRVPK